MLKRWNAPGGYREVLVVSLPLVASLGSITLMQFTDRLFLSHYSLEAVAAALPAGIIQFLTMCFFIGVVSYVNVFVAQYTGAGKHDQVGPSLWQGIWFSCLAAAILASLWFAAEPVFGLAGHDPAILEQEIIYFRILTLFGGLPVMEHTLACFYSGRGLTRVVMFVNITGAACNIPLDWALINGWWIFPELGIAGAAIATVAAYCVMALLYVILVFNNANESCFKVRSGFRFDPQRFRKMLRFGLPGGVQFFLDIFAVTFFVFMVGRLGTVELAATNIVLNLNTLAFLPMIGMHIGISTLVGQAMGAGNPDNAVETTRSSLHMAMAFMGACGLIFVLLPHTLIGMYLPQGMTEQEFEPVVEMGTVLLRFVAFYCLVDAMAIVYLGALKGAGDVIFIMTAMGCISIGVMAIPCWLLVEVFGLGLNAAWACLALYICVLAWISRNRFVRGTWKSIEVI